MLKFKDGAEDIGDEHFIRYYTRYGQDSTRVGLHIIHPHAVTKEEHVGGVLFNIPEVYGITGARWEIESLHPLTLSPSILCDCGDHGYIREGRWVKA